MPAPDASPATLDDLLVALNRIADAAAPRPVMIDLPGFARLMLIGESTLERLKATPAIGPQPVKLGGAVRWNRAEVEAWLSTKNHRGDLYDAKAWPAVWRQIQKL